jgi:hypothetical protein
MAAVTVNRRRSIVEGSKRAILASVTCAATGDTFDTKLKIIDAVSAEPFQAAQPACSVQVTNGVITFNYGGGGGATFTVIAIGT